MTMDDRAEKMNCRGRVALFEAWNKSHTGWLLPAWLSFLCLLLIVDTAKAEVRFDVFLGYDQYVPEASWFPVVCEVENTGPSFHAVVEISPGQYNQGQDRRMAVELPTGTTKRFVIPVFAASRSGVYTAWDARLLDEKGRVQAQRIGLRARKQLHWKIPLWGAISRSPVVMPSLRDPSLTQPEYQPLVARLQANLFPDNPIALEGLSGMYLNAEKALDLKVPQVNALVSWLYQGGNLVVGVEQIMHVNGNEWLRQLLPCELSGLTTKSAHPELQQWLRSSRMNNGLDYPFFTATGTTPASAPGLIPPQSPVPPSAAVRTNVIVRTNVAGRPPRRIYNPVPPTQGTPQPLYNPYARLQDDATFEQTPINVATGTLRDGTVLVGSDQEPYAIIARRGRGQITVLLFSPEMQPFLSWNNRPWFWAKIMGVPPEVFSMSRLGYAGESIDSVLGTMIETKQVRKLPVGWLLLLLIGYLVVIGPLDQYWLKKINRQMLTWLTFPAYVAGFSILIYIIGYKLRAGEIEWNELHLVDVIAEKGELRGRTYGSVYSPANARYKLGNEEDYAALRGEYQRGQESSKATIEQRGNGFVAEVSVPVWTSQLYIEDWLRRNESPLSLSVSSDSLHWYVKVNNQTDRKIRQGQAKLVLDGQMYVVPEIGAKQVSQFTLSRNSGQRLSQFIQNYIGRFQSMASQRHQAFGAQQRYFDQPNDVIAACFISHMDYAQQMQQPLSAYETGGRFVTMPGLDMSPLMLRGDAILLAWLPEYSPVKPINKFTPRRSRHDTLLRVTAEVNARKAEN